MRNDMCGKRHIEVIGLWRGCSVRLRVVEKKEERGLVVVAVFL